MLSYREYETPSSDAIGRRFAYWIIGADSMQLATMELNVAPAALRGAPRLTEVTVDPGAIPRQKEGVPASKTSARAAASPMPDRLSCSGFKDGLYDMGVIQSGFVGMTDLHDDGKTDADGDAKAGDGVYTGRWLRADPDKPADGSWTLRFEGQIQDGNKLFHGQVVEVGPFPIVDGQPTVGPVTLDGTPPAPPTVHPVPGTPIAGLDTPGMPGTGTTTGTGTGTTTPPAGAIDLTGYWKSDSGAIYFVRQVGDKVWWSMDGLPGVRNAFLGSIGGDTLTGTWADLPGGTAIETGTGTLVLKIESNDKLTKVSATSYYGDSTLVRIAKPPGASVGISGIGPGSDPGIGVGGAGAGGTGAPGKTPWETPQGRALIDRWAAETAAKVNAYNGSPAYNARKPYAFNKYGIFEDMYLHSAFAPDDFKDHGNDRAHYMWDIWIPASSGWDRKEWNEIGIPPLRDYVLKALAAGK